MSDEDYAVRKLAGQLARLTRTVDGLSRTRQVARTIISTDNGDKTVGDILEGADEDRDNLNNLEEVVGGLEDSWSTDFDSWVDTQELIKDTVDEAHEAKMQAIESLQDAMDALDGIDNLEADLTPRIEDAQEAADEAAAEARTALNKANQNIQDILTLSNEQAVIAAEARDAWNKAVESGDAAEIARLAAVSAGEAATQAQTTANGKTKLVRSTAAASGQGTTVGDVWWRFGNAQFTGPVIGQWTWSGTDWVPSTIGSEIIEALTVDKLTVTGGAKVPTAVIDTLVGDQAFIGSMYTNRVIVDSVDFAPGPGGAESAWQLGAATIISTSASDPTGKYIRTDPSNSSTEARRAYGPVLPLKEGTKVRCAFTVTFLSKVPSVDWTASMQWLNAAGTQISASVIKRGSAVGRVDEVLTAPAGTVQARIFFSCYALAGETGFWGFRNFDVRPQTGAVLIEDGAVTAPKITASEALSAKVGEFLEVKASQLVADSAAMNAAFIGQLVSDAAFLASLYTNRVIVDSVDFAPGPGGYEQVYDLTRAAFVNNSNDRTGRGIRFNNGSGDGQVRGPRLPVKEGQTFYLEGRYSWYGSSDTGGTTQLQMEWFDSPDGARIGQSTAVTRASGTPGAVISGTVTAPAGATYARFYVYMSSQTGAGDAALYNLVCRPQVGAVLIEDGAITADKLRADAIDGKTITGALIRTSASGQRLQFDSQGLRAFNAAGVPTATITSEDGDITLTEGGSRLSLGGGTIGAQNGLTGTNEAYISMGAYADGFAGMSATTSGVSRGLRLSSFRWSGTAYVPNIITLKGTEVLIDAALTMSTDTAWANFTRASGISGTAQWRRYLGVIYVRMNITTSVATGDHVQLGTLPAAARPSQPTALNASGTAGPICTAYVDTSGIIRFRNAAGHPATAPYVDGSFLP